MSMTNKSVEQRMLISAQSNELRVAVTENNHLTDLHIERPEFDQKKANIYKGYITRIEPSLGAVFINYGQERHGFLPFKEISSEYFVSHNPDDIEQSNIKKLLKEGQELVIQVEKEERGSKGAALTTFISLAGSFLVLLPNNARAGGISRRIDGEEREELKKIVNQLQVPDDMGLIVRTACIGKSVTALQWDLNILLRYWEAIKKAAVIKPAPYLIHQESDVTIRAVRDHLRATLTEVIIDQEEAFKRIQQYIQQVNPDFIKRLKLYSDTVPLFTRFQVEQQIETAYQKEVRLPSGGSIVIDHTEALIAIDINSSRATKGSNIEETALHTNLEAAAEIARQLRIRDIGGLIVIDFIDMTPPRHQREVEEYLKKFLHMDRARIQVGRISRFGLLEMSRQRLRSSLSRDNQIPCPRCQGNGTIRSIESITHSIIHRIQADSSHNEGALYQLQLPVELATYMINEQREMIHHLEKNSNIELLIVPNAQLTSPQHVFKLIKNKNNIAQLKGMPSYQLIKANKNEATTTRTENTKNSVKIEERNKMKPLLSILNELYRSKNYENAKIVCRHKVKGEIYIGANKRLWPCCHLYDESVAQKNNTIPNLYDNLGHQFNDLTTNSIIDILNSEWYEKTLEESWNKFHPLHLPRCYLTCGDNGKRAVIKNIEE